MNQRNTFGSTFSNVLGTISAAASATSNVAHLVERVSQQGHILADTSEVKLDSFKTTVMLDTKIQHARKLKQLEDEAQTLGIDLNNL